VRLGLVLGAGGTAGYGWHTGILRGLEEVTGVDPRTVEDMVGTSAGAYACAYIRGGVRGVDLFAAATGGANLSEAGIQLLARIGATEELAAPSRPVLRPLASTVLTGAFRERRRPRIGAVVAGLLPAGTVSPEPFLGPLRTLWDGRPWPVGLRICAVRARDGAHVVFDSRSTEQGLDIATAVAASSAVPGVMEPVLIAGEPYVDGSVHTPTSADALVDSKVDLVLVSAPMSAPAEGSGLTRDAAVRRWAERHVRTETAALARAGIPVIAIAPTPRSRAVLNHRAGSVPLRRAASARAAYEQVLAAGDDLAAAFAAG
jgi:NTE family protein